MSTESRETEGQNEGLLTQPAAQEQISADQPIPETEPKKANGNGVDHEFSIFEPMPDGGQATVDLLDQLLDPAKKAQLPPAPDVLTKRFERQQRQKAVLRMERMRANDAERQRLPGEKPLITLEGGALTRIIDESEAALLAMPECPIYQRSGLLVRLVRTRIESTKGIRRQAGSLIIAECDTPYLVEQFMRAADYRKWDARINQHKSVDLNDRYAKTYSSRRSWAVPELLATIEAPTLRADGSILETPGYDPESGLLFDPGGHTFLPIPKAPNRDDALSALGKLTDLLKGFTFEKKSDLSTALAALLSTMIRRSLDNVPMFGFNAPKLGSGKTLLVNTIALIANGRQAAAITHTNDANEERKRLISALLEGDPVLCIDNVEHPLQSDALCSILTMPTYKDRILGKSAMGSAPTCITIMATGNNLQVIGDLTRRVLPATIDPMCEKPYQRTFEIDLPSYTLKHRAELVRAALTLLRAYHVAGRPSQGLIPFGSFEGWSDWVRSSLAWLGMADPCDGLNRWESTDTVSIGLARVLRTWFEAFQSVPQTVSEVIKRADQDIELREALMDVAGQSDGKSINTRALGKWLVKYLQRIEGGLRLEAFDAYQNARRYRVRLVS